ncbi:hypothetical protein GBP346_A0966 [Burkholderia pseudomallei MSHR346]|nr:hypothetical protein GBP346_A0966 [Burkholderia pseudomallei MSHR346]
MQLGFSTIFSLMVVPALLASAALLIKNMNDCWQAQGGDESAASPVISSH